MSNKTEEALRREVRDAFFNPTLGLHRSVDILDHPNVRKAFDALRDHYQAPKHANKPEQCCAKCGSLRLEPVDGQARPTFEGDEAEVKQRISDVLAGRGDGTYDEAIEVLSLTLALLDAKDAEIARLRHDLALTDSDQARLVTERDAALSRAEQAEAALAEERKAHQAFREEVSEAANEVRSILGGYLGEMAGDGRKILSRFILPAKPAVDPLVDCLEQALMTDTKDGTARLASNLRAAIERAGGVKAVFGEGWE